MSLRQSLYRGALRGIVADWILPRFDGDPQRFKKAKTALLAAAEAGAFWFHAASAGELESIWTLAKRYAREPGARMVITSFSTSALKQVSKLAEECAALGAKILYVGASPFEGDWREVVGALRPRAFVTVKYEAWPELWGALGEFGVPLVILGARERGSLGLARRLCVGLGFRLPKILLLPAESSEISRLEEALPGQKIQIVADPRWDRVLEAVRRPSERLAELLKAAEGFPKPWGVLAQIWPEDIAVWQECLAERREGTVFLVPHRVDEESVRAVLDALTLDGRPVPKRSSQGWDGAGNLVVLDEMGVLLGLYAHVQWAYVGGGFGKGTHSTLEPAALGLPVSCGPEGTEKAPETRQLLESGQLTPIRNGADARDWLARLANESPSAREARRDSAAAKQGGSEAAFQAINAFLG